MIKLSVGKKIGLGFGVMLMLTVLLGVACFSFMQNVKVMTTNIHAASMRSAMAADAALNIRSVIVGIRGVLAFGEDKFYQQTEQELERMTELQNRLLAATPDDHKSDVDRLIEASGKWRNNIVNGLFPAMRAQAKEKAAGNTAAVRQWQSVIDKLNADNVPISTQISKSMDEIKAYNVGQEKISAEAAAAAADRLNLVAAVMIVFGLSAGIILALVITRKIRRPLMSMLAITHEYAAGDWRNRIKVEDDDEFGELAEALNTMRDNTQKLIFKINQCVEQVAASSQELTANADQSTQAANQVAASFAEVASGANEELKATNEAIAIVEQMSAGIQQMSISVNRAASQSALAADKAEGGGQIVDKAVNQMGQIETAVNTSGGMVAKLGDRSKEIGRIVDTISGIAGQTNLLALNAAVEAARAGEQGRGFAVVAEEVRKLAEQSQEAAKKIAELISEIQRDTDQAVIAMQDGTKEVKTGTEVVDAAGTAFREIVDLVAQVSGQVSEISATTQQMASGSQQIVASVHKIDSLSRRAAGEAQDVSAATEEQLATMEEIATASQAMATLAQNLQSAVAEFRV